MAEFMEDGTADVPYPLGSRPELDPAPQRCHGAGEIEVGTHQDEFGNWDTETFECRGCPDCAPCPLCGGSGDGDLHPGAFHPAPCPACNGRGVDGRKVR